MRVAGQIQHLKLVCLIVLTLLSERAITQTLNFKHLSVEDGLLSSTVYFAYQDSQGYMWFATEAGVNRYDGRNFEAFTVDDGLSDNEILWIEEDSQRRIWFLSLNGQLSFFKNGKLYNPSNHPLLKKAVAKASFVSFFEDSQKRLWLGTNQQEVVMIAPDLVRHYKLASPQNLANSFIVEDGSGNIWMLTKGSFYQVKEDRLIQTASPYYPVSHKAFINDTATHKTLFISKQGLVEFKNGKTKLIQSIDASIVQQGIGHFSLDKDGSLWLSTLGSGIYRFHRNNEPENFLPGRYITHSIKDKTGNIWVSTIGDGVYMLPAHTKNIIQFTKSSGLSDAAVHSISKDHRGVFWLGLRKGDINFLNGSDVTYKSLKTSSNPYTPIKTLTVDQQSKSTWFATNSVLGEIKPDFKEIRYLEEKDKKEFAVKSFALGKNGELAFALSSGVYILNNRNRPLTFTPATTISGKQHFFPLRAFATFYDNNNTLWFSNIKGLHRYENNRLTDYSSASSLLTKRITDIKALPDGTLALATYGYGIVLFKDGKVINHITTVKGLTSSIVTRLAVKGDILWAVTNKGVSKITFAGSEFHIRGYGTDNGLSSNEVNDILIDGQKIYLATNNGLTILRADEASADTLPPPLYLSRLTVNQEVISDTSNLTLEYRQNNISVDFTAINFNDSKNITYRYKLKSSDPWIYIHNTTLDFGSLESAKYHLIIEARSQYSGWSKPLMLNFTIKPPFWRNWTFVSVAACVVSALVIWAISAFFKAQKAKEEEQLVVQNKITSLEQQALQAMMNPHFVFNVMNSIQHFINTRNDLAANKVLTGFARLIRKNMEVCTKSFITLQEEIEYLKLYLSLEALRFGDRMKHNFLIDTNIDTEEVFLPSMLLQPFVENAIWHGIMPKEEGGKIEIRIKKLYDEAIEINIWDDGIGILNAAKKKDSSYVSRGMQLTNDRIKLLNKSSRRPIELKVEQTGESGTLVKFTIPIT